MMAAIAIYIADLRGGGAQRVCVRMANAWYHQGHKVTVITQSTSDTDAFKLESGITRMSTGTQSVSDSLMSGLAANLSRIRKLRYCLQQAAPDCLLSFGMQSNVLAVLAATGLPLRVVISERNDPRRQTFSPVWEWLRRFAYKRAHCVTANSTGVLEGLRETMQPRSLALLPNPVEPEGPMVDAPKGVKRPYVLAVGRLHPQKAYDVLLPAYAEFLQRQPKQDWSLVILGEGAEAKRLASLAQELGIAERITWAGFVQNPSSYFQYAGVYVLPSRHEGMPNALLEAMSHGLAVIVSDASPGPLEMVEDGISGMVVPVEQVGALASALQRLISDHKLRLSLGDQARRQVASLQLERVLRVWEKVLLENIE